MHAQRLREQLADARGGRVVFPSHIWYTRHVYARLARAVADYRRSGREVTGLVGVGASPSCGVATTLDLTTAVSAQTRCRAARLDRLTLNQDIIAANVQPGEGLFIRAIRRHLARADAGIPEEEHDLLAELGVRSRRAARDPGPGRSPKAGHER